MVIFRAWKDNQGYETLGKKKAVLEGRFHEKGIWTHEGFCARQGWVEVWGSKVNGEHGELRWNHLISHCLGTSVDKGSSFVHSSLRQTAFYSS